jgi:hypothetical protein
VAPLTPRDGTIGRDPAGQLWLVTDGSKVSVTTEDLARLGRSTTRIWPLTDADLSRLPVLDEVPSSPLYPGALVRADGDKLVQYVDASRVLRPVSGPAFTSHRWRFEDVAVLPADEVTGERSSWQVPTPLELRDGTLVETQAPHLVGVISGGAFRRIWDTRMVTSYAYTGKPRQLVAVSLVTAMPAAGLTVQPSTRSSWR